MLGMNEVIQCLGFAVGGFTTGITLGYWVGKKMQQVAHVYREYEASCQIPFQGFPSKGLEVRVVYKKDKPSAVICPYLVPSSRRCDFLKDTCLYLR